MTVNRGTKQTNTQKNKGLITAAIIFLEFHLQSEMYALCSTPSFSQPLRPYNGHPTALWLLFLSTQQSFA